MDTKMDGMIKQLSVINPWRGGIAILFQWFMILMPIVLLNHFHLAWPFFIPVYILTVMWIGARQHALAILMHDATHYRLFNNRFWNEGVSELFLAWPLLITTKTYRKNHLAHHRHLNTQNDPDYADKDNSKEWMFPMKATELLFIFVKDILGINIWQLLKMRSRYPSPDKNHTYSILRISYYVVLAGLITFFHVWTLLALYWLVPLLTWFKCILRIRSIAEHFAIAEPLIENQTRTVYPTLFDRLFIGSCNVWHHADHHLYPSVPFYYLPQLHQEIIKHQSMWITKGYWGVLKECITMPNPN